MTGRLFHVLLPLAFTDHLLKSPVPRAPMAVLQLVGCLTYCFVLSKVFAVFLLICSTPLVGASAMTVLLSHIRLSHAFGDLLLAAEKLATHGVCTIHR